MTNDEMNAFLQHPIVVEEKIDVMPKMVQRFAIIKMFNFYVGSQFRVNKHESSHTTIFRKNLKLFLSIWMTENYEVRFQNRRLGTVHFLSNRCSHFIHNFFF